MVFSLAVLFAASYLVGSIPFGLLLGWAVKGVDIRAAGSGNIGATNAGRVLGWKWFPVVMGLDFLKGFLPVLAAPWFGPGAATHAADDWSHPANLAVLAGTAAFLGHLFPIYLGFRGGKGVATGLGVFAALVVYTGWIPLAAATAVFAVVFAATRIVSLGSMLSALAAGGLTLLYQPHPFTPAGAGLSLFAVLVPILVILKHRDNIRRLWSGKELAVKSQADPSAAPPAPPAA